VNDVSRDVTNGLASHAAAIQLLARLKSIGMSLDTIVAEEHSSARLAESAIYSQKVPLHLLQLEFE
jgi:hypothetical protein